MEKLTNAEGVPTGHTFSFLRALPKVISIFKPSVLIFTLDAGYSNRDKIDPEYKANRKKKKTNIRVADVLPIIKAIPCFYLRREGYEADDLSYTAMLALKNSKLFTNVIVLSKDYDMAYVLRYYPKVKHFMTHDWELTPAGLHERIGVLPNRLPLFKAIFGDSSDNIKGLKLGRNKSIMLRNLHDPKIDDSTLLNMLTEDQLDKVHTNLKVVRLQKLSDFDISLGMPNIKGLNNYLDYLSVRTIDAKDFIKDFPIDIPRMKGTLHLLKRVNSS
jgi:5'-3' exonuclease